MQQQAYYAGFNYYSNNNETIFNRKISDDFDLSKNYGDCFFIKDKKDRRLYQNGLRIKYSPKADSVPKVKLATSNYITC